MASSLLRSSNNANKESKQTATTHQLSRFHPYSKNASALAGSSSTNPALKSSKIDSTLFSSKNSLFGKRTDTKSADKENYLVANNGKATRSSYNQRSKDDQHSSDLRSNFEYQSYLSDNRNRKHFLICTRWSKLFCIFFKFNNFFTY